MKGIRVVSGGMLTTVQDHGRFGQRRYGMPVAGAMDNYSFRIANLLVGNRVEEACLELTLNGPELLFGMKTTFAITGAFMNPLLNGESISYWRSYRASKGDTLSFGYAKKGVRAYIAFAGGIDVPLILGSRSTYLKASIGGHNGKKLSKDDEIKLYPFAWLGSKESVAPPEIIPEFNDQVTLRFLKGRDFSQFDGGSVALFSGAPYTITPESDRMGYRLLGPLLVHNNGADVISYPVTPGTIQVPGDGKPILMMNDCQTTGGYTQIGHIITADMHLAAQARPGDQIVFRISDQEEAIDALRSQQKTLSDTFGKKRAVVCTTCYTGK